MRLRKRTREKREEEKKVLTDDCLLAHTHTCPGRRGVGRDIDRHCMTRGEQKGTTRGEGRTAIWRCVCVCVCVCRVISMGIGISGNFFSCFCEISTQFLQTGCKKKGSGCMYNFYLREPSPTIYFLT